MTNPTKRALKACISDPRAVSALLGCSDTDAALLVRAYALAQKKEEPIEDADGLCGWLYWCQMNGMKKDAAALSVLATAVLELPESAPKSKAVAVSKGQLVGFRPKEHAEFTFLPNAEFKKSCVCEHDDVGLWCDAGEIVVLQQLERTKRVTRVRVHIAEGVCEFVVKEWDEVGAAELSGLDRRREASAIFDMARIRDEYVG